MKKKGWAKIWPKVFICLVIILILIRGYAEVYSRYYKEKERVITEEMAITVGTLYNDSLVLVYSWEENNQWYGQYTSKNLKDQKILIMYDLENSSQIIKDLKSRNELYDAYKNNALKNDLEIVLDTEHLYTNYNSVIYNKELYMKIEDILISVYGDETDILLSIMSNLTKYKTSAELMGEYDFEEYLKKESKKFVVDVEYNGSVDDFYDTKDIINEKLLKANLPITGSIFYGEEFIEVSGKKEESD